MMSMTGYGRASLISEGRSVTVELRSVNHRFLDISLRLPKSFGFTEDAIRKLIASRLSRGHLDVSLVYQNTRPDAKQVSVDAALAKQYALALDKLNEALGIEPKTGYETIAAYPDVLITNEAPEDEGAIIALISEALNAALDSLIKMRKSEGERLKESLNALLNEIEQRCNEIEARYPQTVIEYQKRLNQRLGELGAEIVDPARLAQEVALMADRAAVDEETVRLMGHINHAREMLSNENAIGRNLDFLIQEMNREVNTISSKSQDMPITEACLQCKSAIEKLREQVQNIE